MSQQKANSASSSKETLVPAQPVWSWSALRLAFVVQFILLAVAGWQNRFALNTDAIAYLRLAGYYAHGQTDLMISGYWGPLISWLLAPLLACDVTPLLAARMVMGASAILFLFGSRALLRNLNLAPGLEILGVWLVAIATVFWSVEMITPDLLVGGLICLATSVMISPRWPDERRRAIVAGALWGVAYLAKAVALPLAFAISLGFTLLWRFARIADMRALRRQLAITLVTCALASSPWIAILSIKYGRPTFSTTGRIAHAIVGPPDVERYHPYSRSFHQPEIGRITSWEDPSRMPYRYWSPFENREYAAHQIKLLRQNFVTVWQILGDMDAVGIGALALLACLLALPLSRERLATERWRWSFAPIVCLGGIYLPIYVQRVDARYFYVALPLLWAGVVGVIEWSGKFFSRRWLRDALFTLAFVSFFLPVALRCSLAVEGAPNFAGEAAHALAEKFRRADLHGAIAGSGLMAGGRAGLFAAFLLNEPWFGDEKWPSPESIRRSGARFFVVARSHPLTGQLANDGFRDLDLRLFTSTEEASQFPLKVYEVTQR